MDVLKKIGTALRGGTREALEGVVDANGIRILSQEVHDAESAVQSAKHNLCKVTAEKLRLQREAEILRQTISTEEQRAIEFLNSNNEVAAQETAQLIADNELLLKDLTRKQQQLEQHESELKQLLHSAIKQIEQYRRELRMVQATKSAQVAVEKISSSDNLLPRRLGDMRNSLSRIRERQQITVDILQAEKLVAQEFQGERNLINRTVLTPEAVVSVLERLRNKTNV